MKSIYRIFTPEQGQSFARQTEELFARIESLKSGIGVGEEALLQVRFYLSDAANQAPVLRANEDYWRLAERGVASFIEQPPLGGEKIAVLVWLIADAEVRRETITEEHERISSVTIDHDTTFYLHSFRPTEKEEGQDEAAQTQTAFERHARFLKSRGMTLLDNCLRTWIYVRDVDCRYAGVVKARNEVFARHGLTTNTHFIASTGIGGATERRNAFSAIDFLSVGNELSSKIGYLHALEFLNPTHEYGVAFERGAYIDLPEGRTFYISGTASIDRAGKCLYQGEVSAQADRLFLNIAKLLEDGGASLSDVRYLIVYLRDFADYATIANYLDRRFPDIPRLLTLARVCRPEWLIEVECVAVK